MKSMYPKKGRVILHVDMNSFYASVEAAHNPALKGKAIAVAGNPEERRGIIVTSSYEARQKGVKTTMTIREAKRLCPELIILRPNFPLYRKASEQMFAILHEFTAMIEPVSIDEGYLDITDCYQLGTPLEIANRMQTRIKQELGLPCSIGIAPNKFLAKMASDMKKPLGITVLRKRDIKHKLWPLKVDQMHGIGSKTAEKLNKIGIYTIQDLSKASVGLLKETLGINGEKLFKRANGDDHAPVDPNAVSDFKSIGNSTTLPYDTTNRTEINQVLQKLTETVIRRMKKQAVVAWGAQLTIRDYSRKTITRSRKLENPLDSVEVLYQEMSQLFDKHWDGEAIRLLGVTTYDLGDKQTAFKQLDLFSFEKDAREAPLYDAIARLNEKYGSQMINKGIRKKE